MKQVTAVVLWMLGLGATGCAMPVAQEGDEPALEPAQSAQAALSAQRLLALGDSIAFGYQPPEIDPDYTKDKNFVGYPDLLKPPYSVKNAGCPGETSASIMSSTAPDNGCRGYRTAYPLHVNYGDKPTQLAYALDRISKPEDRPTLITLNVAGNDIFLQQAACATNPAPYPDAATCFSANVPTLIESIATNIGTILGSIRGAGYTGEIVLMNLYSTDYSDQSAQTFLFFLNQAMAQIGAYFGATVADAYTAFAIASAGNPCAAGLLIPIGGGVCDVHPTLAGQQVLAQSVLAALPAP